MKTLLKSISFATVVAMAFYSCNENDPEPVSMPKASFTYEKLSANCVADCEVAFMNASTNAENYSWDFGDNSGGSTEDNPTHIYTEPGTYQVTLEAIAGDLIDDTVITVSLGSQVFIVNAGNFGQGNGSIATYDEAMQTITNNAVATANGGAEIDAGLQSLYLYDGIGHIVCNVTDKIEFIDANTLEYVANPVTSVSTPRYMWAQGDMAYITCWGPFSPTFTLEESYMAVMDLNTRTIVDSLETGPGPEGILAVNDKVYIANSYGNSITVYDTDFNNSETIELEASPQHFEVDGSGLLWVAMGSLFGNYGQDKVGFQAINTSDNTPDSFVNIPGFNDYGEIAINGDGSTIYFFITEAFPGTGTDVYTFNPASKTVSPAPLISGDNFFGIEYNATSDLLYVSDAAAYQGPGRVLIYAPDGTLIDEQVTGIGPYHFVMN